MAAPPASMMGVLDVGVLDVGVVDIGAREAGVVDIGVVDVGVLDAGLLDIGIVDVGVLEGLPEAATASSDDALASTGALGRAASTGSSSDTTLDVCAPASMVARGGAALGFQGSALLPGSGTGTKLASSTGQTAGEASASRGSCAMSSETKSASPDIPEAQLNSKEKTSTDDAREKIGMAELQLRSLVRNVARGRADEGSCFAPAREREHIALVPKGLTTREASAV